MVGKLGEWSIVALPWPMSITWTRITGAECCAAIGTGAAEQACGSPVHEAAREIVANPMARTHGAQAGGDRGSSRRGFRNKDARE